jgi:hypothetical protein
VGKEAEQDLGRTCKGKAPQQVEELLVPVIAGALAGG